MAERIIISTKFFLFLCIMFHKVNLGFEYAFQYRVVIGAKFIVMLNFQHITVFSEL